MNRVSDDHLELEEGRERKQIQRSGEWGRSEKKEKGGKGGKKEVAEKWKLNYKSTVRNKKEKRKEEETFNRTSPMDVLLNYSQLCIV